jgi:hypothetical protein
VRNLNVYDSVLQPFSKPRHRLPQIASSLELRVYEWNDIDIGQRMAHKSLQVFWEGRERVIIALAIVTAGQWWLRQWMLGNYGTSADLP